MPIPTEFASLLTKQIIINARHQPPPKFDSMEEEDVVAYFNRLMSAVNRSKMTTSERMTYLDRKVIIGGEFEHILVNGNPSVVGVGGFGTTYKVIHLLTKKQYIMKKLTVNDPRNVQMFKDEAKKLQLASEVNSGVPKCIKCFQENGHWFLVQDHIEGTTLQGLIKAGQGGLAMARDMVLQISRILHDVHQCNLIHRDVKIDNLIRRKSDSKWFLIDFGIARQLKPGEKFGETCIGAAIFMAPETRLLGLSCQQSDFFSLGVCTVFALSNPNAESLDVNSILEDTKRRDPVFAELILKMLNIDLNKRPANAMEIVQTLQG